MNLYEHVSTADCFGFSCLWSLCTENASAGSAGRGRIQGGPRALWKERRKSKIKVLWPIKILHFFLRIIFLNLYALLLGRPWEKRWTGTSWKLWAPGPSGTQRETWQKTVQVLFRVFTHLCFDRVNRVLVDLMETKESVVMMYVKALLDNRKINP